MVFYATIVFKEKYGLEDNFGEALWLEINLPNTKLLLTGTVYILTN